MIGRKVGPYEVVAKLGEGGMGEVYRARDAKLNRDVAIKVLPQSVAADPDRLARFTREAQTLAALNHPNIAAIYGFEADAQALVMELVEGDDLSVLIARAASRGGLDLTDVVAIARQIADALEAAHEQGIIHRDLKPANVKIRVDGTVKVLDFGLAKALTTETAGTAADAVNSPTLTAAAFAAGYGAPGTQMGVILGTAAYMAPEQAKGKPVDRRADIWAFGVVLYEMLTGRRAFEGEDISTTLAAVLMKDPEWAALPPATPPALRQLIHRCLERDPKLRLRDIGEARILLNDARALSHAAKTGPVDVDAEVDASAPFRRPVLPWLVAATATVLAVAFAVLPMFSRAAPVSPVQFTIAYPPHVRSLSNGGDYHGGVISPDGLRVVFSGANEKTGRVAVYVRRVDAVEATVIKGTEGGRYPFWSPDSRSIAFYALGKLNRIDIDGGSPAVICDAPTGGWGGAWNKDDVIVAGVTDPGPLMKVSAKGGDTPKPVTTIAQPEFDHDWPYFLADGRHFIYTSWGTSVIGGSSTDTKFYVGSLDSTERTLLFKEPPTAVPVGYADPGFALFVRGGTLMAWKLNPATFALEGDPIPIASNADGPLSASTNGSIGYTTTDTSTWNRMVWVNADGTDERPLLAPGFYADPAISPDGSMLAYAKKESAAGAYDVWIRTLATGAERQLTFDRTDDRSPVWSPAGDEIVFSASRAPSGLYRKKANGVGNETLVADKDTPQTWPYQWHADGFIASYGDLGGSSDIFGLSLATSKTTPLIKTKGITEARGSVSPNGKWLTYDARETARFELFLTTYPTSASKLPVTTDGGAEAKWSKDGKTLFYVNSTTGALMAATVTPGDPPTFSTHRIVHPGPLDWGFSSSHSFDIDPRTGRLAVEIVNSGNLTVLLNWQAVGRTPAPSR